MKRIFIKTAMTLSLIIITGNIFAQDNSSKAIAVLNPTQDHDASGIVTFIQTSKGVEVTADVTGLTPGKHGFHIHEYGDCSSPNATSAGGHFNPQQMQHAGPHDNHRHVGDLGNLIANTDSDAKYTDVSDILSFTGQNNIIGRAVIIHVDQDDLKTQPTGDAGGRVACGVIGIAKP